MPPTPLLGREAELAAVRRMLLDEGVGLLTLVGPGGVGKTRLAIAVASRAAAEFSGGAGFVDLAPVGDPALALSAVAAAVGLRGVPNDRLPQAVAAALRARRTLLVLDNCEHLLPALAGTVDALLADAPAASVLATSRAPLRLRREQILPVPPLALPDPAAGADPDRLAAVPSVALFAQRARAADPSFALTVENADDVARLVVGLDGLPLAIELAAARARLFAPSALLARLDHRLALLRWDAADLPPRQRSLRAVMDWSYGLLSEPERAVFSRLGAFVGGFTPEAAEAVVDAPGLGLDGLDVLAALADQHLLRVTGPGDDGPRFAMLETVREYALERLAEAGEAGAVQGRHGAFFLALAEEAEPALFGADETECWDRLERELPNLRAALDWAAGNGPAGAALGLRLVAATTYFWFARGHADEVSQRLERLLGRALAAPHPDPAAAERAQDARDPDRAASLAGESAVAQDGDGPVAGARLLMALAQSARNEGDPARAAAVAEEALELFRGRGAGPRWAAMALWVLGTAAHRRGDLAAAERRFGESLAESRGAGSRWGEAGAWMGLGRVARARGDAERATELLGQAVAQLWAGGDPWGTAFFLPEPTAAAAAAGRPEWAARLLGAEAALREEIGVPLLPEARAEHERLEAAVRDALGEDAFAAAWAAGRGLGWEGIRVEALAVPQAGTAAPPAPERGRSATAEAGSPLSPREREVLALVAAGCSNKGIAEALYISASTAKTHVAALLNKLGADTRARAVAVAAERGLL